MAVETLTDLSPAQRTILEEQTLVRALPFLYHARWAQMRPFATGEGQAVTFTRYTAFGAATTALVEGEVPEGENLSTSTVTITPERFGSYIYISDRLAQMGIFNMLRDCSELLGEQAALTADTLARAELITITTSQIADGVSLEGSLVATNVMDAEELIKGRQTLVANNARPIPEAGNNFVLIFHPHQGYDMLNDALLQKAWIEGGARGDANPIWGDFRLQFMGIRGYESSNVYLNTDGGSSSVDTYHAILLGRDCYGIAGYGALLADYVEGGTGAEHRPVELIYHPVEDYPPMNDKMSLAWKIDQAEEILNDNFGIVIITASSIGSNS